ncbi:DMT family transporter [Motiliproteus coralliicola]|uniref:DMT family transporter n=1 Tax=Motiliproteus coralliicola TaxID=2283196 RepID=A0A369WE37_9GAMM|nr:DMT family transporter [Motiliproteus coralliicola]RDE18886.1 DMT family transporter [Motiliproteus coralliicola]
MTGTAVEPLQQRRADLFGLGAVLCWSTVATAFKLSLEYFSPAQLVLFASLFSWLFLGGLLAWRGELTGLFSQFRQHWRISLLLGALNPTLYYLVLFQAYDQLPAQEAQALNYTWALTLSLLAVPLLGHRLRPIELIAALVCYSGVLVIATRGDLLGLQFDNLTGVLLALASTLIWALYWILNTRDTREPVASLFMNVSVGILLLLVYCALTGELSSLDWRGLWGAGYVGLFEMGLSFVFWLLAMKLTGSTARIANLIFISPLLSLVLISTILDEPILASTLVGLGLILTGLGLQRLGAPKPAAQTSSESSSKADRQ